MMTIYKVTATVYDYFYTMDRDGYKKEEKFFLEREKAEEWIKTHKTYAHKPNGEPANKKWEMPKFEIKEIEVE